MGSAAPIVGVATSLAGTAMSVKGQLDAGAAAKKSAYEVAEQQEFQATQEVAAGQHAAAEIRRQSELLQSHALAMAGASGGGVADVNVLKVIGGIAQSAEDNVQREKFSSTDKSNKLKLQAKANRTEGKNAKKASKTAAIGTAFSGLTSAMGSSAFGG